LEILDRGLNRLAGRRGAAVVGRHGGGELIVGAPQSKLTIRREGEETRVSARSERACSDRQFRRVLHLLGIDRSRGRFELLRRDVRRALRCGRLRRGALRQILRESRTATSNGNQ
jgi:hypothetical protein